MKVVWLNDQQTIVNSLLSHVFPVDNNLPEAPLFWQKDLNNKNRILFISVAYGGYTVTGTAHAYIKDAVSRVPMNEYMCILLIIVSVSPFIRRRYLIKEELIRITVVKW
jgi:hypothetical protein